MQQAEPPQNATIRWVDDQQPLAERFNDFYFSLKDGLAESRYVFLEHSSLIVRWQALSERQYFTLAETGFGTGLNFLATWQAWRQSPKAADTQLHFISVEKYPLTPADLERALSRWPELQPLSQQLLLAYPPTCNGFYQLPFAQENITLTLLFGDATEQLAELDATIDAWYLDGFSPAKNPDLWTDALFRQIANHSRPGTTFATFTAASSVRKGLQTVGFNVQKKKGFGGKREMLSGQFTGQPTTATHWYQRPQNSSEQRSVIVIGAGIAGATTANALARRGCRVTVIDRGPFPASEASGNPQGVLYLKLPATPTVQSRIHLSGYHHTLGRLQQWPDDSLWSGCGVLQLVDNKSTAATHAKLVAQQHYPQTLVTPVDAAEASAIAGLPLSAGGLYYPSGGWVAPRNVCQRLLDHPLIECHYNTTVDDIDYQHGQWLLMDKNGVQIAITQRLVVACAASARAFTPLQHLPLKAIRGQISQAMVPDGIALNTVLCGKGYVSPPHQGQLCFGATFTLNNQTKDVVQADHLANLAHLYELCPELAGRLSVDQFRGRTAFRCATPDYLPVAGPAPDQAAFIETYGGLRFDATRTIDDVPPLLPGLFVNLGHGSKGLITAPLCGELVASQMCGTPLPLPQQLVPYLHPARFTIKELKHRAI